MTKEAQLTAIAEACGWKREETESDILKIRKVRWIHPSGAMYGLGQLPDYLSDLNAAHEMEKVLTNEQFAKYWKRLQETSLGNEISATAKQRSESFLRVLNLWDDNK